MRRPVRIHCFDSGAQSLGDDLATEQSITPRISCRNRNKRVGAVRLEMQQVQELDVVDSRRGHRGSLAVGLALIRIARLAKSAKQLPRRRAAQAREHAPHSEL